MEYLIKSKDQISFWEPNSCLASPEIPRILLNPKIHYRIQNSQPTDPILKETNPVHVSPA